MNDYAQHVCIFCQLDHCDACVGRSSDRWCECWACQWLTQGGTE